MPDTLLIAAAIVTVTAALVAMITLAAERRARSLGRRAQSRFVALMDATGFGVLVVDGDGRISYANNNAVDTLGYPEAQLEGRNKHQLLHQTNTGEPDQICPLQQALLAGRRYVGNDHFVDARGNLVPIAVSTAPLTGATLGAVILFRDRSTEVAEARQREQAFALISHELRSPLTTVVGFSQRLARSVEEGRLEVPHQQAEELSLLAQEAARMRDIVTIVLEVATVDRRLDIEAEPILLLRLATEEVDRMTRQAPGARFVVSGDADVIVESDDRYVRRVMQNLVENAVKYGSTAAPIEVTVARTHDGGSITVRDHGPGIPRDAQARVFERFYRQQVVEGSRPGLGLGLFLARRLADRLGGRLSLESEVGHGAAFTFALPAEVPESVASHHREPTAPMRWSPPDHQADN